MTCQNCGAQNAPTAAFCSGCAANLRTGMPMQQQMPMHAPMPYPMGAPMQSRFSGMAITGFVLSFFCGLLGLIFSSIALGQIKKSNGALRGGGLAIAGIVIASVGLLLNILFLMVRRKAHF